MSILGTLAVTHNSHDSHVPVEIFRFLEDSQPNLYTLLNPNPRKNENQKLNEFGGMHNAYNPFQKRMFDVSRKPFNFGNRLHKHGKTLFSSVFETVSGARFQSHVYENPTRIEAAQEPPPRSAPVCYTAIKSDVLPLPSWKTRCVSTNYRTG